tara:strand:+ start:168 stop:617 length:450 start_codon:yes stop_codon:yes gene_type:complete
MKNWINLSFTHQLKVLIIAGFILFPFQPLYSQQDFRCAVRLTFDSDSTGSVANYVLSLQLKNTKGRNVKGASILYKDSQGQVIGNTFLDCLNKSEGIKPGSYGNCTVVLQRVDGEFLETFGTKKWTDIVNTQLSYLNEIQYCDLLGFSY